MNGAKREAEGIYATDIEQINAMFDGDASQNVDGVWNKVIDVINDLKFGEYPLIHFVASSPDENERWRIRPLMGIDVSSENIETMILKDYAPDSNQKVSSLAVRSLKRDKTLYLLEHAIFVAKDYPRLANLPTNHRSLHQSGFYIYERADSQSDIYLGNENDELHNIPKRISLRTVVVDIWKQIKASEEQLIDKWDEFRSAMLRRTQSELASLNEKYIPGLYTQRAELKEVFDRFLASDKTGFLLVGDSGSGKTNFMCALANYMVGSEDIPILESASSFTDELKTQISAT